MTKFVIFIGFAIAIQLISNECEQVVAQSFPANQPADMQKRAALIGGISVEHPLQATVYAYRRGKMKLLVPFEITVVPMGGLQPEQPPAPNGYPYSGPVQRPQIQTIQTIQPQQPPLLQPPLQQLPQQQPPLQQPLQQQQTARFPQYAGSVYGQQAGIYQGSPSYYLVSNTYQQPYNPYNPYNPNTFNNGCYNQPAAQNTYYPQPPRRTGFPQYRPQYQQPQYRPPERPQPQRRPNWQHQNATNVKPNWSQNNTAVNINSLIDDLKNLTQRLNATTLTPVPTTAPPPRTTTLNTTTSTATTTTNFNQPTTTSFNKPTTTNFNKPTRQRKPMTPTSTTTTAAARNSTKRLTPEIPATVKEIQPKVRPNSLLYAQLPGIEELIDELDPGYHVPSNFAPETPIPDPSIPETPIPLSDSPMAQGPIL